MHLKDEKILPYAALVLYCEADQKIDDENGKQAETQGTTLVITTALRQRRQQTDKIRKKKP